MLIKDIFAIFVFIQQETKMRIFKRIALTAVLFLVASVSSLAVFNEKDLAQTLQVLRYELRKAYVEMEKNQMSFESQDDRQHEELVHLIQSCNELSLMLYSQKQDFTFDLTYALQQVTDQYHSFTQSRMPYDNIISYLNVEIDRYDRLVIALKVLPPELVELPDSLGGPALLDSLTSTLQTHLLPNDSYTDAHSDDPEHAGHYHFAGLEEEHEHHHHDHDEHGHCCCHDHDADEVFTNWGMETPHPFPKSKLESILHELAEGETYGTVIRCKGMLEDAENRGHWMYFDLVPGQTEVREGSPEFTGKVVVIGAHLDEEALKHAFCE